MLLPLGKHSNHNLDLLHEREPLERVAEMWSSEESSNREDHLAETWEAIYDIQNILVEVQNIARTSWATATTVAHGKW